MSLRDRLRIARKEAKKTQAQVAEAVGMSQPAYQALETGRNKKSSFLPAIASYLKADVYWLTTGNGKIDSKSESQIQDGFQAIKTWDDSTPLEDDEVAVPFFKDFSFACGSGYIGEAMLNEKRRLRLSKSTLRNLGIQSDKTCAASACGNSMSPTINDGDTVHIDMNRKTIKDGKVFALCHGGLFLIKRLYNLPMGGVRIVSDNAVEFPEVHLTAQEIQEQQFEVLGWVWQVASLDFW